MDSAENPQDRAGERAARLAADHAGLDGSALLEPVIRRAFPGRIAVVASFGTESALLLALVADVDPRVPVIFLDTGKHFEETLEYRDQLRDELGLEDVRSVKPDLSQMFERDLDGTLWSRDANACCHIRKVLPLRAALAGFDAWISGRKRYHGGARWDLPTIEAAFVARGLPRHPLLADGYLSVGCEPCTEPSGPGADLRSGRWAGLSKTECGIHFGGTAGVGC